MAGQVKGDVPNPVRAVQSAQKRLGQSILSMYNVIQFLLWSKAAYALLSTAYLASQQPGSFAQKFQYLTDNVYYTTGHSACDSICPLSPFAELTASIKTICICNVGVILVQEVSCFEIAFVLAGILKTPLFSVVMQLLARNTVILLIIQACYYCVHVLRFQASLRCAWFYLFQFGP